MCLGMFACENVNVFVRLCVSMFVCKYVCV